MDKTENNTLIKEVGNWSIQGGKPKEVSPETAFYITGTNQDSLTITQRGPLRHCEFFVAHVQATSALPNTHTSIPRWKYAFKSTAKKLISLYDFFYKA